MLTPPRLVAPVGKLPGIKGLSSLLSRMCLSWTRDRMRRAKCRSAQPKDGVGSSTKPCAQGCASL